MDKLLTSIWTGPFEKGSSSTVGSVIVDRIAVSSSEKTVVLLTFGIGKRRKRIKTVGLARERNVLFGT